MEVVPVAPEDALVLTRKRWQGVEGSSDGASGFVLQRSMGPIHKKLRPSVHGEDVGRLVQIWNVGLQGLNNWRHWENFQPAGRLWRAAIAPGNMRTLAALTDTSKRPTRTTARWMKIC